VNGKTRGNQESERGGEPEVAKRSVKTKGSTNVTFNNPFKGVLLHLLSSFQTGKTLIETRHTMLTAKMPVTMGADDEAHANEISPFTVITVLFTFRFRHNSCPFNLIQSVYVRNKIRRFLEE
jgi:hypothetical protein